MEHLSAEFLYRQDVCNIAYVSAAVPNLPTGIHGLPVAKFAPPERTYPDSREIPFSMIAHSGSETRLVINGSGRWCVIDLESMVIKPPVLVCLDHSSRLPCGVAEQVHIRDGRQLEAHGYMIEGGPFAAADIVCREARAGKKWELSIAGLHDECLIRWADGTEIVNGRSVAAGMAIIRGVKLKHISFVEQAECPWTFCCFEGL